VTDFLWILLILILIADLACAAVRATFIQARLPALINLREKNPQAIDQTLRFMEKTGLRATLRASSVIMHFLVAGMTGLTFERLSGHSLDLAFSLGGMLTAAVVILIIEFLVEGIILRHAEKWSVRLTPLGKVIDFLFRPAAWLFQILQPSYAAPQHPLGAVSEDELKTWAETEQGEGALEIDERKMIYSIFHFSDTLCREIMVPRIDVSALDVTTFLPDAIQALHQSGHSRVPVYEDVIDNVVGMLYAKDLLKVGLGLEKDEQIRNYLRQAYFVPEAKKVDELLREMQANGVHIAVVIDEYGGMAGLVTLEDIVEEIVGEIRDEYDQKEELPYQQVGHDEYLFQGRIDLDALNEILNTHFTRETAETLGGLIYSELGHVPAEGEHVLFENWIFSVEQVIGRRIRLVRAAKHPAAALED
jgi:putative hemolysin